MSRILVAAMVVVFLTWLVKVILITIAVIAGMVIGGLVLRGGADRALALYHSRRR